MDGPPTEASNGLFSSVRRVVDNVLGLAQNRLELLALELREEKYRLVELLAWTFATVALAMVAVIVVSFTIVVFFWDSARIVVLVTMSCLYIGATIWVFRGLQTRLHNRRLPLADSLNELRKDRECLQGKR